MEREEIDSVLLVCADPRRSDDILDVLLNQGYDVVGPVETTGMALALTAQSYPTMAVVAGRPSGHRDASELADSLMRIWGIRTLLLDDGELVCTPSPPGRRSPSGRLAQLKRVLADSGLATPGG